MKKIIHAVIISFFVNVAGAQMPGGMFGGGEAKKIYDGKITGNLTDGISQKPMELANITLFETGSDKPLDGVVSDEKGNFKLKEIKNGKYKVTISFLGYITQSFDSLIIAEKKTTLDLGKIIIQPNSKLLKEATVETEKALIETKIDRIIYNADKDISNKGGNATDVLRKVPMVTVDLDGNPTLQGTQNIKVLINNKPSSIMAGSVSDALKMIPADEIEKVEVITSPSAKYDAEGTGGIINIVTKKKNMEGLSGSVNAGAGTRSSNLFSNINYHHGRFGTGVSIGGFGYQGTGDLTAVRTTQYSPTLTSVLKQTGTNQNLGAGPFVGWNVDYDITSKNSLSGAIKLRDFFNSTKSMVDNFLNDSKLYTSNSKIKGDGISYDANLDYKRTFATPDREFTISLQNTESNRNTTYDITNSADTADFKETSLNESRNRETTFQTDYVHPFSKKFNVNAGAKTILRDVTSTYDYKIFIDSTNSYQKDIARSNEFDYKQNIFAGYLESSLTIKNFGIKAGARYEKTEVSGSFSKNNAPFNSGYDNLIPSITFSYRKPGKHTYKISYTQRIQRPSMTFLNPYVNSSDPQNISYGNKYLSAEKSHAFEFGYNLFKGWGSVNTSVYHRFTDNAIESVRFIDTLHRYVTTYHNIGKNYSTGVSIGANIIYKGKLFCGSNFNAYYYKVLSTSSTIIAGSNTGVNYSISYYASYKFSDRWSLMGFGTFNGPKYSIQGKTTSYDYYNLSARWQLKNEKGGFGLGLDNFASWYLHLTNTYSGQGFTYNSVNKIFFLGVRVSFDYRFGKVTFADKKKKINNDDLKPGEDGQQPGMGGGK